MNKFKKSDFRPAGEHVVSLPKERREGIEVDARAMAQEMRLRGSAWGRLSATMDAASAGAERNGLTDEDLDGLLADES